MWGGFKYQVLAGERLIANFPEVSAARRRAWRTSDGLGAADARLARRSLQTSFVASFLHHRQNSGGKIDGRRGWSVCAAGFVVVAGVTARIQRRLQDPRTERAFT